MRWRHALALVALPLLATPAYADCVDEARAALLAGNASGPYRMEGTSSDKTAVLDVVSEVVPPYSMHMRNQGEDFYLEATVRDGRAWTNDGSGWIEQDEETARTMQMVVSDHALSKFDTLKNVVCLGLASDGGEQTLGYVLTMIERGRAERVALSVDPVTGRPVRVRVVANLANGKSSADVRITYDAAITVELPPGF